MFTPSTAPSPQHGRATTTRISYLQDILVEAEITQSLYFEKPANAFRGSLVGFAIFSEWQIWRKVQFAPLMFKSFLLPGIGFQNLVCVFRSLVSTKPQIREVPKANSIASFKANGFAKTSPYQWVAKTPTFFARAETAGMATLSLSGEDASAPNSKVRKSRFLKLQRTILPFWSSRAVSGCLSYRILPSLKDFLSWYPTKGQCLWLRPQEATQTARIKISKFKAVPFLSFGILHLRISSKGPLSWSSSHCGLKSATGSRFYKCTLARQSRRSKNSNKRVLSEKRGPKGPKSGFWWLCVKSCQIITWFFFRSTNGTWVDWLTMALSSIATALDLSGNFGGSYWLANLCFEMKIVAVWEI